MNKSNNIGVMILGNDQVFQFGAISVERIDSRHLPVTPFSTGTEIFVGKHTNIYKPLLESRLKKVRSDCWQFQYNGKITHGSAENLCPDNRLRQHGKE